MAQAEGAAAEKLKHQGLAASAYHRMVRAWVFAAGATATSDILELVQAGDLIGARAKLHEFEALAAHHRRVAAHDRQAEAVDDGRPTCR